MSLDDDTKAIRPMIKMPFYKRLWVKVMTSKILNSKDSEILKNPQFFPDPNEKNTRLIRLIFSQSFV